MDLQTSLDCIGLCFSHFPPCESPGGRERVGLQLRKAGRSMSTVALNKPWERENKTHLRTIIINLIEDSPSICDDVLFNVTLN